MTVTLKQYGDGQWFLVGADGNTLCNRGMKHNEAIMWLDKHYPDAVLVIEY